VWDNCIDQTWGSSGRENSPKWRPKNETFELLIIERRSSQCRKLYVRQLCGPNFGVLRGRTPKMALQTEFLGMLNKEIWNSQCKKMLVSQLVGPNLGVIWGQTPHNGPPKPKLLNFLNIKKLQLTILEVVCETISWTKFRSPQEAEPPKMHLQKIKLLNYST